MASITDCHVDLIRWQQSPFLHLVDHLVGDPGDGLLEYRGATDLREVRADRSS
jgi:hypothetical protein